ncbi:MAG: putative dienelactone hydrolase [Halieaceae bacterium]|jgi:predicted dienelactone hydrolase
MKFVLAVVASLFCGLLSAQENRVDNIRPDAPELATYGQFSIGVRTIEVVDSARIDVLNTPHGGDIAVYDRALTVEIWYPAQLKSGQTAGGQYQAITRNPAIVATLNGAAVRDAEPVAADSPFPLLIISHGYPGNRYLLSHTGENLASKGYVVASIDHAESTYDDLLPFPSTLYHRPLDQRFVLDAVAELALDAGSFLYQLLDAERTGIIGYSMGGYGLMNNLGAGYSDEVVGSITAPPNRLLSEHASSNADFRINLDSRIKAGFAVATWGMKSGYWRAQDLAGINVPVFFLAGDADTIAGYEGGTRAIFENAVNTDRYLLTFKGAAHNAGAPHPAPLEILNSDDASVANHYNDPVWDNVQMNNIMDHFVTAWFDYHLKGVKSRLSYLELIANGADAVYSVTDGKPDPEHDYWKGFAAGTALELKLEYLSVGE